MARYILEQTHAMIGNTIDVDGVVIEFNAESPVRSAYVVKPNGDKRWRNIHETLSEALSARDDKVADRREKMTHDLEITKCG